MSILLNTKDVFKAAQNIEFLYKLQKCSLTSKAHTEFVLLKLVLVIGEFLAFKDAQTKVK